MVQILLLSATADAAATAAAVAFVFVLSAVVFIWFRAFGFGDEWNMDFNCAFRKLPDSMANI